MTIVPLTERQQAILDFIHEHLGDRGAPPTRADIMARFGFRSPTAADDHLKALARKGAIELLPGAARGIRVLADRSDAPTGLPIVGRVAAGQPIMSDAGIERWVPVEPGFSHRAPTFCCAFRANRCVMPASTAATCWRYTARR